VEVGVTTSFAWLTLCEWPSNVTRAFSDAQERLALFNRASMVFSERGIEKLVDAEEMRRGMESPSVTLFNEEPERVVVVHPVAPVMEQVDPVKPLVHMHAHDPLSISDDPPFWQAVVELASHCWTADKVVEAALGLRKTKNSRGTTTAAAMIIRSITTTTTNPQHGSPQQRRRLFSLGCEFGPRGPSASLYGDGQDDMGRGVPSLGVATPGGGKAASIPERPERRFSSLGADRLARAKEDGRKRTHNAALGPSRHHS
jgi:hypothetical protein